MAELAPTAGTTDRLHVVSMEVLRSRQQIEDEIEERIAILDRMDGNPDLEPNGDDEPSLGWSRTYAIGGTDDLEEVRA